MKLFPGVIAMAAIVVASNILVQFLLLDGLLTWGAFSYPLAFLVTDVMNRIYGPKAARQVVLVGFVVGIVSSLIGTQIILEHGPAVSLRVAIGSATAFLVAQLLDIAVFDRLRGGKWWRAPLASTVIGSSVDTLLFFTISFAAWITIFGAAADADVSWAWQGAPLLLIGPEAPLWVTLMLADWVLKLLIGLLALIPFRLIVTKVSQNMV
ncbi:queuosine precursor transporter [Roseovarius nubinhibens]|uniref:Probable queuosine precursor transporter n=1 Tax=Roseovarius nubinhibens (strain ATCC BAA-591 / DSM 15170 / ISM) TaxID=89187 RepID=A3SKY4_ROSNI|nr:queuosine precursor transporter [Roseovarius nubinhibens]EAP78015.1 membrane protein, putative [Roseovarius nubinhibens ISM]